MRGSHHVSKFSHQLSPQRSFVCKISTIFYLKVGSTTVASVLYTVKHAGYEILSYIGINLYITSRLRTFVFSQFVLGALLLAIEDVNKSDDLLPGWNLSLVAANTGIVKDKLLLNVTRENRLSTSTSTIRKMTEMRDRGVTVFIGPDKTCTNEALVAAAWNIPMISYVRKILVESQNLRQQFFRRYFFNFALWYEHFFT